MPEQTALEEGTQFHKEFEHSLAVAMRHGMSRDEFFNQFIVLGRSPLEIEDLARHATMTKAERNKEMLRRCGREWSW